MQAVPVDADVVGPHSLLAAHDRYRIPYLPQLFPALAQLAPLDGSSRVLDLCCGTGPLALGVAPHVREVVAVDAAEGMLRLARAAPNTRYLHHDVNAPEPPPELAGRRFQAVTIGRAIEYVGTGALRRWLSGHLAADGCVVVCGSGLSPAVEWCARFQRLLAQYGGLHGDFMGQRKLADCGLHFDERLALKARFTCDRSFLLRHALSYALGHRRIRSDLGRFTRALRGLEALYAMDGRFDGEIVSWMLVHRPGGALRKGRAQAAAVLRAGVHPV